MRVTRPNQATVILIFLFRRDHNTFAYNIMHMLPLDKENWTCSKDVSVEKLAL